MRLKKSEGFTLLEVMVGLIIFSLGLLLLSSMLVVALRGNVWSDKTTQIVQTVRDKIEEFRHAKVADMVNGTDMVRGMSRSWAFEDVTSNLKKITVVVDWHDQRSVEHQCTTATYIQVGS